MKINYHKRSFRLLSNSTNGDLNSDCVFIYHQKGNILTCSYQSSNIIEGHLMGIVSADGSIHFSYQQINDMGILRHGKCKSIPLLNRDGKLELHESWEWTDDHPSKGSSVLIEI